MSEFWNRAFDLDGRCAVITGGAAGIGLACAGLLVERGARVVLLDRDPAFVEIAAGLGTAHIGLRVDLCQIDQITRTIDTVADHFKRIDYLVNSAGVAVLDIALDVTENAWDTTLEINLKASFFVAQEAGLQVPTDISVAGFDDISMAAYCDPPLTTVEQPAEDFGRHAVHRLVALIENKPLAERHVQLPFTLKIRASACAPAGAGR
ncbi:SDR family NAD(P)-dependent oxidoreductase [Pseudomonas syringae]|uniref:SDR family NAD(P)-dependent oxidoreductase n=1 Tax=Pseudomonas sp. MWU16-30316 TaxID=2878093 RepID=UPI00110156D0|nr:SDR family NAD(P)-dependent oxidoreductase [Pseudomonas sp. MWU16-30316]TFZ36124.1 SDR family NAD(P)-dependent oxidoreductase [Pseudomonas syringae]